MSAYAFLSSPPANYMLCLRVLSNTTRTMQASHPISPGLERERGAEYVSYKVHLEGQAREAFEVANKKWLPFTPPYRKCLRLGVWFSPNRHADRSTGSAQVTDRKQQV